MYLFDRSQPAGRVLSGIFCCQVQQYEKHEERTTEYSSQSVVVVWLRASLVRVYCLDRFLFVL